MGAQKKALAAQEDELRAKREMETAKSTADRNKRDMEAAFAKKQEEAQKAMDKKSEENEKALKASEELSKKERQAAKNKEIARERLEAARRSGNKQLLDMAKAEAAKA